MPDDTTSWIWRDGVFVKKDAREALIGLETHALHYGDGIFEGMRAYYSEANRQLFVFRPHEHYERFLRGARVLGFSSPYTVELLTDITLELLRRNGCRETTYIRPIIFVSNEQIGVSLDSPEFSIAILTKPMAVYRDIPDGLHATISSQQRPRDSMISPGVKISGGYVNPIVALRKARLSGFDDAILLNDRGFVTEAATANLFIVRHPGTLHDEDPYGLSKGEGRALLETPPPADGILRGITRDSIIQIARGLGMRVEETSLVESDLLYADEVFFCGTAYEVAPVTTIDHSPVGDGAVGSHTALLRSAYGQIVRREVNKNLPIHLRRVLDKLSKMWTTAV